MRQILKSYLKSYFKNWIEASGLILFVIIIIATIAGILSGALQYKLKYNDLTQTSQKWDYFFVGSYDQYNDNFIENYYLHNEFIDKNNHKFKVTGEDEAILDVNSTWWKTTVAVCNASLNPALQKNCRFVSIMNKLNEIETSRGTKQNIDGINPIAWKYFKKYNYNRNKEIVTRLLTQAGPVVYSAGFFETIAITQQSAPNYNFTITSAVVPNLTTSGNVNFNQLKLYQGRLPTANNEVVVSSLFAEQNNFKIGDTIAIIPSKPAFNLTIVGIGNKLDNFIMQTRGALRPTNNNDIRQYGVLFTTPKVMSALADANAKGELGITKFRMSQKVLIKLNNATAILSLKNDLHQAYINPTTTLVTYDDGYIATQTQNINIQIILYSAVGSVLLFLGFVFINYTMKKEMNKTRRQIGIFKAFGYRTSELSWVFSTKFFLTMFLGVAFGYCFSIPIQLYVNTLYTPGLLIPFSLIYAPWQFMLILFLVVPIFFTGLSFLFIYSYLRKPSLVLIHGGGKLRFNFLVTGVKKVFQKTSFLFRMQLAFTLKGFLKWMIVMFIFFISSLLFIIQFNASDIFGDIVQSFSNVYQKDVDHRFQFPNTLMMAARYQTPSGDEKLQLINNNHFRVIPTANVEQTQAISLATFHALAVKIHKNPGDLATLRELLAYQPIYQSVYLSDLTQVINDLSNVGGLPLPSWLKNIVNWTGIIDQTQVKTVLTFNTLYYNPQTELPLVNLPVTPSINETAVTNDVVLKGIEPQTWAKFYQMQGIKPEVVANLLAAPLSRTAIPAIISEKMARLNKLHLGDLYEFSVKNTSTPYNISIVVKGIIKNDTTRRNVFVNVDAIRYFFRDFHGQPVPDLYNGVISKEIMVHDKINPKDLLTGKQNYKITLQNLTINIFNHDITDSLDKIMRTVTSDGTDVSIFTSPNNVEMIALQKLLAQAGLGVLNDSLLILQILNGMIIFIILAVITSSVIDEASQIILTMWALGYKPRQVNFIIIGNYVLGVLLMFLLAYVVSLVVWYFAIDIILNQFRFVINLPLNWQTPVKVGVIISTILVFSWLLSMYLVKKRKLNELTE
ncbi:ABC transporter permease [Spiroplasma sp. SV19]|uniref:ABC transporter permease n=1 Tax=Spiroplasma sp. SV19 TaxID=2570468 RepID=UPI0024B7239C|nr:ABC transporter permease [Spiroplasma sp. SV19]WHQ36346.1 FtsX-like permease family protein [Spiroplasma sp. SV19]